MTQVKYGYDTIQSMTMIATTEERWLSSPLVQYAIEQAGSGADEITVLATLSDLLNELEERCPGVPFSSILAGAKMDATRQEQVTSANCLLSMGMDELEVADLLAVCSPEAVEQMGRTGMWRLEERLDSPGQRFEQDRAEGMTALQIARKYKITQRTVFRHLAQVKLTRRAVEALAS